MNPADFFVTMERLTQAYRKAKSFALETMGLTDPELKVLDEVTRKPGTRLSALAAALSLTAGTASKIAGKLMRKGLVSLSGRSRDPDLAPTRKGRATKVQASEEVWHAFAQALGGAASIARAVAGLITTLTAIVDRWMLPPKAAVPGVRPKRKKR